MPIQNEKLAQAVEAIKAKLKPRSIFLYGSHSRAEAESGSDFEVGVVRQVKQTWKRRELFEILADYPTIHGYAFDESTLRAGHVEAPFPETIFIRELTLTGRTIDGEKVIETLKPPPIILRDLYGRIHFDLGVAQTAIDAWRRREMKTAKDSLIKSCLFGIRAYLMLKTKTFSPTFERIVIEGRSVLTKEQQQTLDEVFILRKKAVVPEQLLFDNLELLNDIREEIEKAIDQSNNRGDTVVLS